MLCLVSILVGLCLVDPWVGSDLILATGGCLLLDALLWSLLLLLQLVLLLVSAAGC